MNFLARLREPSTWAGLSGLAILFGVQADNETIQAWQGLAYILGGAAAAGAVMIPERKAGQPPEPPAL